MGLDFSHTTAYWPYSAFHRFRVRLAHEVGIDLDKMAGFDRENNYEGISWEKITDPIKPFLNHSDCDGDLPPDICAVVAPRLRELVKDWEDGRDKTNALLLADGMEEAHTKGESLEFM